MSALNCFRSLAMHPGLSDFVYCFGVEYMGDSTEDDEETYGGGEHRSAELKTSL